MSSYEQNAQAEEMPAFMDPRTLMPYRVAGFQRLHPECQATDDVIQTAILAVDADPGLFQSDQDREQQFGQVVMGKIQQLEAAPPPLLQPPSPPPAAAKTTPSSDPLDGEASDMPQARDLTLRSEGGTGQVHITRPESLTATQPKRQEPIFAGAAGPTTPNTTPAPTPASPPRMTPEPSLHPLISPPTNDVVITEIAPTPPASSPQDDTLREDDEVVPTRREPSFAAPASLHTAQPPPATPERTTADQSAPTSPRTSTTRPTTARGGGGGDKGWIFALICLVIGLVTAGTCVRDYYKTAPTAAVPTAATPAPTATSTASPFSSAAVPTAAPSATGSLPPGWLALPIRVGRTCPSGAPLVQQLPETQRRDFFAEAVDSQAMIASAAAWTANPTRRPRDLVVCPTSAKQADGSRNLANCQVCLQAAP